MKDCWSSLLLSRSLPATTGRVTKKAKTKIAVSNLYIPVLMAFIIKFNKTISFSCIINDL